MAQVAHAGSERRALGKVGIRFLQGASVARVLQAAHIGGACVLEFCSRFRRGSGHRLLWARLRKETLLCSSND